MHHNHIMFLCLGESKCCKKLKVSSSGRTNELQAAVLGTYTYINVTNGHMAYQKTTDANKYLYHCSKYEEWIVSIIENHNELI